MSESNNVVSFAQRKLMKDAEPAIQEVVRFRHFYDDNMDAVQFFVDNLMEEMDDFYTDYDFSKVAEQDYALLIESTMALLMRIRGLEHPLCHPFADEALLDRPKE